MIRFALLTQPDCPNCETLKLLLARPLKGQYADRIEEVHRERDAARFTELSEAHHVKSTPALIRLSDGEVLTAPRLGLGEVKRHLEAQP